MVEVFVAALLVLILTALLLGFASILLLLALYGPGAVTAFMVASQVSRFGADTGAALGAGFCAFILVTWIVHALVGALIESLRGIVSTKVA